jgi:polyisoprenoid-binding protein YceI
MKIQNWFMALTAVFSLSLSTALLAQTFNLDSQKSEIEWKGTKVGGSHEGTIQFESGSLVFKDGQLSSGELVVDMNSIVNTDISDPEKQADLVGHLKSDDFFAVSDHSTAKIVFTDISKKGDEKYEIKGDFTVRGITKPITFTAELKQEGDMLEGESELSFDRAQHNVKYNSGTFFEKLGDKLIHDKIQLDIKIAAKK